MFALGVTLACTSSLMVDPSDPSDAQARSTMRSLSAMRANVLSICTVSFRLAVAWMLLVPLPAERTM